MQLKHILVPIDFSEQSARALRDADELASTREGDLTLLHVHPISMVAVMDFTYVEAPADVARLTEAAEAHLRQRASDLKTPAARVTVEVVTGDPVTEIIRRSESFDLIVMGTHGRTALSRLLMGSVAERVVRGAHCSVMVVR